MPRHRIPQKGPGTQEYPYNAKEKEKKKEEGHQRKSIETTETGPAILKMRHVSKASPNEKTKAKR